MTTFAWEFVTHETREFCGRHWVRTDPYTGDHYVEIEGIAQKYADMRGVEIDVISCGHDEDMHIVSREREGIRVRPTGSPYVSAFGEIDPA
jgi:hypothetical protein